EKLEPRRWSAHSNDQRLKPLPARMRHPQCAILYFQSLQQFVHYVGGGLEKRLRAGETPGDGMLDGETRLRAFAFANIGYGAHPAADIAKTVAQGSDLQQYVEAFSAAPPEPQLQPAGGQTVLHNFAQCLSQGGDVLRGPISKGRLSPD